MEKAKNERNEGARELCAILAHKRQRVRKRKIAVSGKTVRDHRPERQ